MPRKVFQYTLCYVMFHQIISPRKSLECKITTFGKITNDREGDRVDAQLLNRIRPSLAWIAYYGVEHGGRSEPLIVY